MKNIFFALIIGLTLTGCNKEPENLMSPCVGAEGSPCDRTPVNPIAPQNIKV